MSESLVDQHNKGFRSAFLDYDALTQQLQAWAMEWPDLAHLQSIGRTPGGRELWVLTVGRERERIRPAAWVDGNMHASELSGTNVALTIAEDLLRIHLGESLPGLTETAQRILQDSLVYVMPRVSPDGAEAVLETGRYVRSVDRDERPGDPSRWISEDVDGDGQIRVMRLEDPTGEFVESASVSGLMVLREPDDPGPFYKVWPEGLIEHFDGHTVPDPDFLGDNYPDLNRNFPWDWHSENTQPGAGDHPGSEPESAAIIQFARAHPHIFAWLNLHTFGGVHIRPCGEKPDKDMHPEDLAIYRYVGERAEALTSYPMVSGFEEFTYKPDTPIRGDLSEWAYNQRGCLAWVCEIWDIFAQIGMPRPERFVDFYTSMSREDMVRLAEWDAKHNNSRVVQPWVPAQHPQLGPVEVGGIDPRIGCWNPPPEKLSGICSGLSQLWLETMALGPEIHVDLSRQPLGDGWFRVSVKVTNTGYLGSAGLPSAAALPHVEPLRVEVVAGEVFDQADRRVEIGHLAGWGRGRGSGSGALYYLRSRGSVSSRTIHLVGSSDLAIRVGSCRVGWTTVSFTDPST